MQLLTGHLEELVLTHLLREGSQLTKQLVETILKKHRCTKQGVYRVVRKLKSEEKIIVYRSRVSVNSFWQEQVRSLFAPRDTDESIVGNLHRLKKGDRISLTVRGLSSADKVWSHLFVEVENRIADRHPLFLYNPHNWAALLREETDRIHIERLTKKGRAAYLLVGATTTLDKKVTQRVATGKLDYSFGHKINTLSYVVVVADYLFQMTLLGDGNSQLQKIFSYETDMSMARKLLEKSDHKITCRIVIEKDQRKALPWKKRIGKEFFIPKKYRDY